MTTDRETYSGHTSEQPVTAPLPTFSHASHSNEGSRGFRKVHLTEVGDSIDDRNPLLLQRPPKRAMWATVSMVVATTVGLLAVFSLCPQFLGGNKESGVQRRRLAVGEDQNEHGSIRSELHDVCQQVDGDSFNRPLSILPTENANLMSPFMVGKASGKQTQGSDVAELASTPTYVSTAKLWKQKTIVLGALEGRGKGMEGADTASAEPVEEDNMQLPQAPGPVSRVKSGLGKWKPISKKGIPTALLEPLGAIRKILRKAELSEEDVDKLLKSAKNLQRIAQHNMLSPVSSLPCNDAIRKLGLRFLVFEALYTVSRVVGPSLNLDGWMGAFGSQVPHSYQAQPGASPSGEVQEAYKLAKDLSAALYLYKTGEAPSESQVVDLKRRLFFAESSPLLFRLDIWNDWRLDLAWRLLSNGEVLPRMPLASEAPVVTGASST